MKKITFKIIAILMILAGGLISCKDKPLFVPYEGSWKLTGIIYDHGSGYQITEDLEDIPGLIKLEPKDCDTCYTFTFVEVSDKGSTIHGISILNAFYIKLNPIKPGTAPFEVTFIDEQDEPFDGNLYREALKSIITMAIWPCKTRFEILFEGEGKNHSVLIYKRINP
ncbi:MAG: hypothetical protein LBH22_02960 [Bacteroidales bacterium]|jgi:hypothetical protein|nr:hypothetical protein [Bacteroidales bacterium]